LEDKKSKRIKGESDNTVEGDEDRALAALSKSGVGEETMGIVVVEGEVRRGAL